MVPEALMSNVNCTPSTGLYGGAEGAFGSNAGSAGGEGADAGAGKVFIKLAYGSRFSHEQC